jgi:hypothetical protein
MSLLDKAKKAEEVPELVTIDDHGDECSVQYVGPRIRTVDELIEHQQIDLAIWEIVKSCVKAYGVSGKRKTGRGYDTLWNATNLSISIELRRRAPKPIQDAIRGLLADVKPLALSSPPKQRRSNRNMLEVSIYDHHWGKLAWSKATGTSYDVNIADREWRHAIDSMLAQSAGHSIEQIVMPIGNDLFHVNDWQSQTANGTRVESTDDRFERVFRAACKAVQYAVERCYQVAPVKLLYVPGNHDRHTSWFLCEWLAAKFSGVKLIDVDNSPRPRKYLAYGPTLLGYMHGDEVKPDTLPTLMATEVPQMWAASRFRRWNLGHWHKRKETRHTSGDTFNGVEVRILPSLCGTDAWHYSKGFTGNARKAECSVYSREHGPSAYYITHATEPVK